MSRSATVPNREGRRIRDDKAQNVKALIRMLVDELAIKVHPLDGAWLWFGLNQPKNLRPRHRKM